MKDRRDSMSDHHGTAPDVHRGSEEARLAGDRAFGPPPEGPQWPGREPSKAESRGVPATDMEARTPLGVGTSMSRRAERVAEDQVGRHRRGHGRRPSGQVTPDRVTGVGPQGPIDEESPYLPTGDQAS
jgi:hypothetical protein